MNIYLCDAGVFPTVLDQVGYDAIYVSEGIFALVAAETRGKARALFLNHANMRGSISLEWTDTISINLIARDVDRPAGVVHDPDHNDPFWKHPRMEKVYKRWSVEEEGIWIQVQNYYLSNNG